MAAKLTADMKRVVAEQRLAFVATVCHDGTPNLSPKGTIAVWDDAHLVFADIRSPGTIANLERNPAVEVNVVDRMSDVIDCQPATGHDRKYEAAKEKRREELRIALRRWTLFDCSTHERLSAMIIAETKQPV